MAEDKRIDCAVADGREFANDLATTFVECYKSIFDIELKIDELEKIATEIIPEEFKICDVPLYLNKFTNLVQEVVVIPNDLVSALNTAISGVTEEIKQKADELKDKATSEIQEATDKTLDKVEEKSNEISAEVQEKSDELNTNIDSTLQSLKLPLEALKYPAMTIILKRFQIIKYRCEIFVKSLMVLMAKLRKKVLVELLSGKDDSGSPVTIPIKTFLMTIAVIANVIAIIIGIVLNIINAIVILNVDASGCAFGPTPKSMMMTSKMTVANVKGSTTSPIPEPIDKLITEAENAQKKVNGELKKAQVLAMASASAASVANGGQFSVGDFPALPKLDGTAIRQAIKLLLMALIDAEALPRYEKLTPINIRFMVFLITGFEPAAKKTFGLPGFP